MARERERERRDKPKEEKWQMGPRHDLFTAGSDWLELAFHTSRTVGEPRCAKNKHRAPRQICLVILFMTS